MILSYLYNKVPEKYQEDIAAGLAAGIAVGLAVGLVVGIAVGLAVGLVVGLVVGLAFGLAVGLAFGLAFGLAVGLVDIVTSSFQHSIFILITILIISEVLYWLDKNKLDKDMGRWLFTLIKKGECLLETSIIIINLYLVLKYFDDAVDLIGSQGETIHMVLIVVGYGTVVVLVVLGFVWFNSLKYKDKK